MDNLAIHNRRLCGVLEETVDDRTHNSALPSKSCPDAAKNSETPLNMRISRHLRWKTAT